MRTIRELPPADRKWAQCVGCHSRVVKRRAVWIGIPSFTSPALCVCVKCLARWAGRLAGKGRPTLEPKCPTLAALLEEERRP